MNFVWRYALPLALMLVLGALFASQLPQWWVPLLGEEARDTLQLTGALGGSVLGFVLHQWLGGRSRKQLLVWLKRGQVAESAQVLGEWQELAERMRRTLREERKLTEAETRKLQDFLLALQASPNGVILLDARNQIEWFNQTAAQLFGFRADSDERQTIEHLIREPDFVSYLHAGDYSEELVLHSAKAATGSAADQISVQIHPYGQGRKLMLARDVTQIAKAEAMRRDFVANVSHELRTPLTVLNGFVETMQSVPLTPGDQRRYLELMAQQGLRMKSLVEDLLTLSRLEASALPGLNDWFDLGQMLGTLRQEALTLSDGRHALECHFSLPESGLSCSGSTVELHSAFSNLVSNAIRYTPAQGQVRVHWQTDAQGRGVFSVTDTGGGIAPEHLPRLTERFYRVDRSRSRETGGTGLGLAIVKHVVQRHGGELLIESEVGKGSTFTIRLPAQRLKPSCSTGGGEF